MSTTRPDRIEMGEITVGGETVPVTVSTGGTFRCTWMGHEFSSATFDDLIEQVQKAKAKTRTRMEPIPFTIYSGRDGLIRATATGIHGGTGNVMYRTDGRKGVQQLDRYGSYLEALDEEETSTFGRLEKALDDARSSLQAFLALHSMDIKAVVHEAVSKAEAGDA